MIDYKTSAKPRIVTKDDVAVFCSYDEIMPIGQLQPNPRNPNQHTEQQVKLLGEIIRSAGWRAPITVSKRSRLIVKGHGRRLAAIDARLAWVPVEYQEYATEAEEYADLLADNRIAELAEMDNDKLSEILKDLQETENFDMDLTGFDEDALADLIGEQLTSDEIEEDEVPETQETVFTKPGDLFIMGEHRLLCGDSTKLEDVNRLLGGQQADLYITDPPYNVAYVGKTKDALTIENDKMADGDFRGACKDIGWDVRECLIWNKNTMVLGRQDYQWKHEPCLYGWKPGAPHNWYSDRKQTTVIDMSKPTKSEDHPTMKPVGLFAYQIENSSKTGDIVLDSFAGSGTTMVACEKMGRKAMLMELDPKYCDVIIRRYIQESGNLDLKVERDGKIKSLKDVMEEVGATLE